MRWVGEYPDELRRYIVENKNKKQSTLSIYLGCFANILLNLDKYKFQKIATEMHLGSKNTKAVSRTETMKGKLISKDRNAWK